MVKMLAYSWEKCGISCFLPKPVHQAYQSSSLIRKKKNLKRKWKKKKGCRRFKKLDENEIKTKKKKKNGTVIVTKIERRTEEIGGVAAEIDLLEILAGTGLARRVPKMTKRTQKKILLDGIKKRTQKLKRRRKKQMGKLRLKRNRHLPSHPNVNHHPSMTRQSNKKSLRLLLRRNAVIEEIEETVGIPETGKANELTGANLRERKMIADVGILLENDLRVLENIHQLLGSGHLVLGRDQLVHVSGHPVFERDHRALGKEHPLPANVLLVSARDQSLHASVLLHVSARQLLPRDQEVHVNDRRHQGLKCADGFHVHPAQTQSLPVVQGLGVDQPQEIKMMISRFIEKKILS